MTIQVTHEPATDTTPARLVLTRGDRALAEARLDPAGWPPTEPEATALRFTRLDDEAWEPDEVEALAAAALARAIDDARGSAVRVVIGWDPLDAAGQAALERAGFRPTGRQPYFVLGGGHVEYVMGYADVAGATLDLIAHGGSNPADGSAPAGPN